MTAVQPDGWPPPCTDPGHTHTTPTWHARLATSGGRPITATTLNPALMVARLPAGWSVDRWTW